ncbi:MAG: Bug family tripartite tricarboxylate transporter substrate binding protein [Burkholderiales bacterium]
MRYAWTIAVTITLSAASTHSLAQSYPVKPVRVIVPAAPGGGLDLTARAFTPRLAEIFGQNVVIENRAGANFILGTEAVAKATPDGYTLLYTSHAALTINPVTYAKLPYATQDLAPISVVYITPSALLVHAALQIKTVQDLVAQLRANPGKFNHGSNSASTILASELLKSIAKVDYQDINYKGGVLAAAATAAGEIQFCIVDMGSATAPIKSGRVRMIAVTTPQRSKLTPDTPTVAESGVPGYAYTGMTVLLAPAKTPPEIVGRTNAIMKKLLAEAEIISKLETYGGEAQSSNSPEDAVRVLREELERWERLVKERGLKFQ